jgi:serine/threonine protein phosphatase PrpC
VSGQRKALIIANDTYTQEALRNLRAPAADAEALRRVLADPQIGDFAVQVVSNEPSHAIAAQIEDLFSESRPDDLLLVHFSGHGLKSESGELFFAAPNTRTNRLGSTAVAADFLQRCMRDSRSRSVVLLLDCCYSGAFARGVQVRAAEDINVLESFPGGKAGGGRGRAVITASSAMEFAFEAGHLGDDAQRAPSVFTSALVEGLATGDADRDGDGWVSLDELYDYVFDKVRERNPHQTPSRRIELEGELYLARSRRRVRPALIPADLEAALADTNMYTRLGALTELRSRLLSDNLPAAAAAYGVLAELARTASRYLAAPAVEALSEVAMQPIPTELHFGEVEQGSASPHQVIRLLGPPIARACDPRPSHTWIRVGQVDKGLDISIDTTGAGILQGSLALDGPTGQVTIAIDVDLRPKPGPAKDLPQPDSSQPGPRPGNADHVEWDLTQAAGVSDRGRRQPRNEDAMDFAVIDDDAGGDPIAVVGIVADGMSTAPRPGEASWRAVQAGIPELAERTARGEDPVEVSLAAVEAARRAVNALAGPDGAPATTWVSAVVGREAITVCRLGDSRAYWLTAESPVPAGSDGTIDIANGPRQVTRDDSVARKWIAAGLASAEEATADPQAHVISRWLGADLPDPQPYIEQFTPTGPGVLLLCSDGLWNYQPEAAELASMALPAAMEHPLGAAADLVKSALDSGGLDNITVVLIPFPPRADHDQPRALQGTDTR